MLSAYLFFYFWLVITTLSDAFDLIARWHGTKCWIYENDERYVVVFIFAFVLTATFIAAQAALAVYQKCLLARITFAVAVMAILADRYFTFCSI